jgi:hypothetical protein
MVKDQKLFSMVHLREHVSLSNKHRFNATGPNFTGTCMQKWEMQIPSRGRDYKERTMPTFIAISDYKIYQPNIILKKHLK